MIHRELCKRLKFNYIDKLYIHKPESVLGNAMHEIPCGFEIQTDRLILVRRQDLELFTKKKNQKKNELNI